MNAQDNVAIDRRAMLTMGAVASLAMASAAEAAAVAPDSAVLRLHGRPLTALDLTHKLTRAFAFTPSRLVMDPVEGSGAQAGMAMNRVCIVEHTGTHLDAPRHFSEQGATVGDLPIGQLIVPLCVVDIRAKVSKDRDARVTDADLRDWEKRHGRIPPGACVAMLAGWDPLAQMASYNHLAPTERGRSPGFDVSTIELLVARDVRGIAVDTLSLDAGGSMPAYPFHQAWLRRGRWGLEAVTNLDRAPPAGGLLFAAVAPLDQATGAPARAIAIF